MNNPHSRTDTDTCQRASALPSFDQVEEIAAAASKALDAMLDASGGARQFTDEEKAVWNELRASMRHAEAAKQRLQCFHLRQGMARLPSK